MPLSCSIWFGRRDRHCCQVMVSGKVAVKFAISASAPEYVHQLLRMRSRTDDQVNHDIGNECFSS